MRNTIKKQIFDKNLNNNSHIDKLIKIGMALSSEKDINKLLEIMLDNVMEISNADAGSLYVLDKKKKQLNFKIVRNYSMNIRMGENDGNECVLPPVPLEINNEQNLKNVSSYVAIMGKSVNINDVYDVKGIFDLSGPKKYDAITGYRTKSMLVIPLKNHKNNIIGVLQLINSQDIETNEIINFSSYDEYLITSIASLAAVALTNAQLIQNLKELISAFITSMAAAIDEKSPYTGGHIRRVVDLSMLIAKAINKSDNQKFIDIVFNADELEELRIAAWMHDVGKMTVPEYLIDKATKLEKIIDRIDLVETRFQLIETLIQKDHLNEKIELLNKEGHIESHIKQLEKKFQLTVDSLRQDLNFIKSCNNTGDFMPEENIARIKKIGNKRYVFNNKSFPFLNDDEVENLCIQKGTLTDKERLIIENHAKVTQKITGELPFPDELSRVSEFASNHHERPDGKGYPNGFSGEQLAIQSRIIAIADIFEALTAKDRPYREPMNLSKAIKILEFMQKDNQIDRDIYELFMNAGIYKQYAKREIDPKQIDMEI
ncbi:HD family phosphohydrolase [Desulfobacula phenolica]|uniref:HD-GYP domain, c-di-GMP phosphodiesterase class II (Or its inactivated variant) n=1 Tax=Desulfobacula phenolica TaxID=90732 RepID=A0A1H2K785_9BACT|nr:HD family phosphohydrolase [Desulfobacula phenolica]SDU64549.1 HD-GYP domain, c-di-GMP phosphodiesterase class II (or its inactivated variant) [Desulfobacula phenolica]